MWPGPAKGLLYKYTSATSYARVPPEAKVWTQELNTRQQNEDVFDEDVKPINKSKVMAALERFTMAQITSYFIEVVAV